MVQAVLNSEAYGETAVPSMQMIFSIKWFNLIKYKVLGYKENLANPFQKKVAENNIKILFSMLADGRHISASVKSDSTRIAIGYHVNTCDTQRRLFSKETTVA